MNQSRLFITSLLLALALVSGAQALPTYNSGSDFSSINNPNGPWSYGYQTELGGTLNLYSDLANVGGLLIWRFNINNTSTPGVAFNQSGTNITFASTTWRPAETSLHPGPNGEFSVLRFTAPETKGYILTSLFNMRSFGGTSSTDVHVLLNDVVLFNSIVAGFNAQTEFNDQFTLSQGDRLDFVVGDNGSFFGDTTAVQATLSAVPLPAAVWFFGSALAGVGLFRRRRT
jgi:hypothetical protein